MEPFVRRASGLLVPPEPRIHRPHRCDLFGGNMTMAGGGGTGPADPLYSSVAFLLSPQPGDTVGKDYGPAHITVGNSNTSIVDAGLGNGRLAFNFPKSNNVYMTISRVSLWEDSTWEALFVPNSLNSTGTGHVPYSCWDGNASSQDRWTCGSNAGQWFWTAGAPYGAAGPADSVTVGQLQHIVAVRQGTGPSAVLQTAVNGVWGAATAYSGTVGGNGTTAYVGKYIDNYAVADGKLLGLRISTVCRYSPGVPFTVPTYFPIRG